MLRWLVGHTIGLLAVAVACGAAAAPAVADQAIWSYYASSSTAEIIVAYSGSSQGIGNASVTLPGVSGSGAGPVNDLGGSCDPSYYGFVQGFGPDPDHSVGCTDECNGANPSCGGSPGPQVDTLTMTITLSGCYQPPAGTTVNVSPFPSAYYDPSDPSQRGYGNEAIPLTVSGSPCAGSTPGGLKGKADDKAFSREMAKERFRRALDDCDPNGGAPMVLLLESAAPFSTAFLGIRGGAQTIVCVLSAQADYEQALAQIDPADRNFLSVAVPRSPHAVSVKPVCSRPTRKHRTGCRAAEALAAVDSATASTASIWAAIDTAMNRLNTATAESDSAGVTRQNAALEAYDGELISAEKALDSADRALASELIRLHAPRLISKAEVRAESRRLLAGRFPADVARRLRADGITSSRIASVFKRAFGSIAPRPINVVSLLRTPMASGAAFSAIEQDYASLSASDLQALIGGLAQGGSISQTQANKLSSDLSAVLTATGSSRTSALAVYRLDLSGLSTGARVLLQTASKPALG